MQADGQLRIFPGQLFQAGFRRLFFLSSRRELFFLRDVGLKLRHATSYFGVALCRHRNPGQLRGNLCRLRLIASDGGRQLFQLAFDGLNPG